VQSLRDAGHLPPLPEYPYFKIRSDDPVRAAGQVVRTLGADYAQALALELMAQVFSYGTWTALGYHVMPVMDAEGKKQAIRRILLPRVLHKCAACAPMEDDNNGQQR
jgi:hypothetical protein